MADRSKIEWTDASWNPIRARLKEKVGAKAKNAIGWHCERVTTGCGTPADGGCYAEAINLRLGTGLPFKPGHLDNGDVELFLDENILRQPLRWKKPRKIFPGSMTDLFGRFVKDEWLDKIFATMALTPQHDYQVLTKRSDRMRAYLADPKNRLFERIADRGARMMEDGDNVHDMLLAIEWPLPNVWLGVSTERQQEADARIPDLLATPAAARFISAEPLLGPLNLKAIDVDGHHEVLPLGAAWLDRPEDDGYAKLDLVIVGGESGLKARSMHPDWARSLRDQCQAAGVAFFFKQWGEWAPSRPEDCEGNPRSGWQACAAHPHVAKAAELYPEAGAKFVARVGKKAAGRLLDGVAHDTMPERRQP